MKKIKNMVRNFVISSIMAVCVFGLPVTLTYLYFTGDSLQRATVWAFAQLGQDSWTQSDAEALGKVVKIVNELKERTVGLQNDNQRLRIELKLYKKARQEYQDSQSELVLWAKKNNKLETLAYVKRRFGGRIRKAAKRYGVDEKLIIAVISTEWDKRNLRSKKGAKGLMQLMPRTAKMLKVNPEHEFENILGGTKYLAKLQKRFSSLPLAIAAYNAGPTIVAKKGDIPPFAETINYVNRVLFLRSLA